MTPSVLDFVRKHAALLAGRTLEVGAFNENGCVRDAIPVSVTVDMRPGAGVDMVVDVSKLVTVFGEESFDGVISCESLEHMEDWDMALENMWGVLKPGGALLLTMAAQSKGWHGYPGDYWRIAPKRLRSVFAQNEVIDQLPSGLVSIGVVVKKVVGLDMSVRPDKVER